MRISRRLATLGSCLVVLVQALSLDAAPAASAAVPAPAWAPIAVTGPTHLPPGDEGTIAVYIQNVGGATSFGSIDPIEVTDVLPPGLVTSGTPTSNESVWSCSTGAGQSTVVCTYTKAVGPGLVPQAIKIPVSVGPATSSPETNLVSVSGGGAAGTASYEEPVTISTTAAKPGVAAFSAGIHNSDGTLATQAGSHPYVGTTVVFVNSVLTPTGKVVPAGDPKTIEAGLPPGLIANPIAAPRCTEGLSDAFCPIDTQVGLAQPLIAGFGAGLQADAVHAVQAPIGYPGKLTFSLPGGIAQVNVIAKLRSDDDYGVSAGSPNTPQVEPVYGTFFSFWGAPADASHDGQRCEDPAASVGCGPSDAEDKAFVTLPMDCALQAAQQQAEQGPFATLAFDTWLAPGAFETSKVILPVVSGCDQLHLDADFSFQPGKGSAATPSAFEAELTLPQKGLEDPNELASPPLRRSVIALPAGVTLNPSAADGLQTCSLEQMGYKGNKFPEPNPVHFDKEAVKCPEASKVGTVEVKSPLLENPSQGSLYLAAENENPFGSLLGVYLVIEDPAVGIVIKLAGEMRPDPTTGQLSTIFNDTPQLPFSKLVLKVKGGDRAPLATPDTCVTATTRGQLTPWSAPESGPDTITEDSFKSSIGPNGTQCANSKGARPFAPVFSAGTASTKADTFTPLEFKVTRKDGEQELKGISFTLPPGLTGKLAGIGTCSSAQIAAAEAATGKAEQASSSCPSSSRIGTVNSAAGIGNAPFHVSGNVYLAGPYKGAPLSVVAIVPAVAGPFDVGNVVVRSAAYLDPVSAQLTAVADSIPNILKGIPVQLRSVRVVLDRPGFTLTPTNCSKMAITAKLIGAGGDTVATGDDTSASVSVPFQVGGCDALAFKPKLSAKLTGGTARNAHPSLKAEVTYPPGLGYANTAFAQVALPHSEFLDQGHIDTVCTRVQFAANACPAGSIYGEAEATTPLLDEPLVGNVYLRSSANKLPDLAIAFKGPESRPLEAVLDGRIDSIHGGIRSTIEAVPDIPVSKFVLRMKGGNKGLLVNSRNLCTAKRKPRLTVRLIGQNGKRADQFPLLGNDCKKHKGHRKTG